MKSHTVITLALATLLVTACAPREPTPPPPEPKPHGYVEGAEEVAETRSRLVVADGTNGAVRVLDLITGRTHDIGQASGVRGISTDGRFGYLATANGTVRVVDGGSWTVDHGDHVHYYRAEIRDVGSVRATAPVRTHSDSAVVAVSGSDGAVTLLDRQRLDDGRIQRTGELRITPGTAAVPYEQHVLAMSSDSVRVLDRNGREVTRVDEPCPQPSDGAATPRGVVFGCADGALLVTADQESFRGAKIPYPEAPAPRATEFQQRPGSDVLAARAGADGAWVLDLSNRSWTYVHTGPVTAVNAVGAGGPLLALGQDGTLRAYDAGTGVETARTGVTAPIAPDGPPPTIRVDTSRAYVNDIAGGTVYEIDYNDNLRIAREFRIGARPAYMVETGR